MERLLILTLQRLGATVKETPNYLLVVDPDFHAKAKEIAVDLIGKDRVGFHLQPAEDWYSKKSGHESGLFIYLN